MVGDVVLDVSGIRRRLSNVTCQPLASEEYIIGPIAAGIGLR